ncbi:MAG: bifunctional 4-hydroxy-2-oxoglutarate aldolase/2-dehydro-3-deoxy-phosphogluconate aldolase [Anaerolineales bacterium]
MDKKQIVAKVEELGLLAVIRGPSADLTVKMVEALVAGGVLGIEITYSTPDAEGVVRSLANKFGDSILLGMGTVTEPDQVERAKAAGARYLVSPVCDPDLVRAMVASGLPVMAGCLTPTEIFQTYRLGADVIKIFPGSLAGPSYIKAVHGPLPEIPMMPTGGVSADNVKDWFAAGAIAVGAGSNLCPPALAKAGKFDEISRISAEFVQVIRDARQSG